MRMIQVFSSGRGFGASQRGIALSAEKIMRILRKRRNSVEIYLIGNKQMRFLNKKFRGKDRPTNILSFREPKNFPHPEMKSGRRVPARPLGEIYLNIPYIKKEARQNDTPYSLLVTQLLVHGLFHLLGYGHEKKSDRMKMEKKEELVMKKLKGFST